ncbi:hypothetical protein G6O69_28165 [Pseudenhygromyxa sp. WMMC2535]|uniref:hypothetical protein n=1 Tax=Pseudenhygromyxa sp. WMMC2535 TaxID=2712867 RepID=UPI0015533CFF|nr:hypothetical protein [Pseudenhygromyxa sp. WMMC2535]NVB41742.1 hypothetical protein [Pseudenhygromyxa sp. WMMC2535]
MQTTEHPAIEAAAFADFEDLDSWQVYADWLTSRGDPRAELVSLSLRRETSYRSERAAMRPQLAKLETEQAERVADRLTALGCAEIRLHLQRGFVTGITASLAALTPGFTALMRAEPVHRLTIQDCAAEALASLLDANPECLTQLRYLKLQGTLGEDGCAALARQPLPRLRRLNLLDAGIDDEACLAVSQLDTVALESVTLTANEIGDEGIEHLITGESCPQWRELYLSYNPISAQGVAALARAQSLAGLERLAMREIEASFADLAPLAEGLPGLRRLEADGYGHWQNRELDQRLSSRFGKRYRLR